MASDLVLNVTEQNFDQEILQSDKPVLLDFWATWCGPCVQLSPIIDEIAEEKKEAAKVAKVNVDEQPGLAAKFSVRSIPTLLFFKDGEVKDQLMGVRPKQELISRLDALS